MENDEIECPWSQVFNEKEKDIYKDGLLWSATVATMMGCLTNAVILKYSTMKDDRSYLNFSIFTTVSFFRRALYLAYLFFFNKFGLSWPLELLAFFETFSAVLEIEALTHACIERYVVSKYIVKGWSVNERHYRLFTNLCLFFATLYALPALVGFGSYQFDFDCETYTFGMLLSSEWKQFVVTVFWMRSVKPVFFMIIMLKYCWDNEKRFTSTPENLKQIKITKTVATVSLVSVLSYTPIFLIRAWVVYYQLSSNQLVIPAAVHVMLASWLHWISPALITVTLFAVDDMFNEAVTQKCFHRFFPCLVNRNNVVFKEKDDSIKID